MNKRRMKAFLVLMNYNYLSKKKMPPSEDLLQGPERRDSCETWNSGWKVMALIAARETGEGIYNPHGGKER